MRTSTTTCTPCEGNSDIDRLTPEGRCTRLWPRLTRSTEATTVLPASGEPLRILWARPWHFLARSALLLLPAIRTCASSREVSAPPIDNGALPPLKPRRTHLIQSFPRIALATRGRRRVRCRDITSVSVSDLSIRASPSTSLRPRSLPRRRRLRRDRNRCRPQEVGRSGSREPRAPWRIRRPRFYR